MQLLNVELDMMDLDKKRILNGYCMVLEEMLSTRCEKKTVESRLIYGSVVVQRKATIDEYDLEEEGLAT